MGRGYGPGTTNHRGMLSRNAGWVSGGKVDVLWTQLNELLQLKLLFAQPCEQLQPLLLLLEMRRSWSPSSCFCHILGRK